MQSSDSEDNASYDELLEGQYSEADNSEAIDISDHEVSDNSSVIDE